MDVLEITIWHRLEAGWPVVAEHTRPGELPRRSEDTLALNDGFKKKLIALALQPREYGEYLGRALFHGEVRATFDKAVGNRDAPLRVLLVVEAPELKPLRWERLCAPLRAGGKWDFLILNQSTPYSLYLPSLTDRRFPAIGRRNLHALVVLADPPPDNRHGLARFDAQATADSVRTALGEIPHDILGAAGDSLGPATLDELCARITSQHYSLLHVVAHGGFRQADGETILYLLDREGQLAPVTATQVIEQLDRLGGRRGLPHLCFLATCESASPEAEGALGGLAQRLVRELGIPAVVAMTEKVSIDTAQALAGAFYRFLRETGLVDQALVESVAALQRRHDVTVPALFSRLGGRPLFSDQLGERQQLTDAEIRYGLELIEGLLPERAPVLRPELGKHAQTLRDTLGADPEALSDASRKARHDALDALNALSEEALDLSFPAVALDQPIPTYDARCPFPGLKAFQTDEREFFFGREKKVEELRGRLSEERFLAVLGGSGSGKSSLVLAGMIPSLEDEARQSGRQLQVRYLTPGANPEADLAGQLDPALPADQPALLVVDQFEELFTLCLDPSKRKGFLDALVGAWTDQPNLLIVLTLRADFWGDCAPYPSIKALMQAHQELLAPMTTPELRSAMEQQAARVGLRFEVDLSHSILAEVEGEPGAMPLLQHLLLELWRRRHGRWLRASEYRELGGIKQAIAHTADGIYAVLKDDPRAQGLLRSLFVRLTRLDDTEADPDGRRDTRQRVPLAELTPAGADPEQVRTLVQRLADARLVVTTIDPETGETQVEVSHEALIRHWPRLRGWLDEDRASWILLAAVREQARDWHDGGERETDLPRWGGRLQQAETLFAQERFAPTAAERRFVDSAKELAEREQKARDEEQRQKVEALEEAAKAAQEKAEAQEQAATQARGKTRVAWIGTGVAATLLVVAVLFGVDSYRATKVAEQQRAEADEQRAAALSAARSQQLTASVGLARVALADGDRQRALKLSADVVAADPDPGPPLKGEALQILYAGLLTRLPLKVLDGRLITARDGKVRLSKADGDGLTIREYDAKTDETKPLASFAGAQAARCTWASCYGDTGIYEIATSSSHPPVDGMSVLAASPVRPEFIFGPFATQAELSEWLHGAGLVVFRGGPVGAPKSLGSFSSDPEWDPIGAYWSDTGRVVAVVSRGGSMVFGPGAARVRLQTADDYSPLFAVFSLDDKLIATSSSDYPQVRLWDSRSGKLAAELPTGSREATGVAFAPKGDTVVVGTQSGLVALYSMPEKRILATLGTRAAAVAAVDFDRTGTRLCALWEDGTAMAWNTETLAAAEGPVRIREGTADRIACEDERMYLSGPDVATEVWNTSASFDAPALRVTAIGDPHKNYELGFDASGAARLTALSEEGTCAKVWVGGIGEVPCSAGKDGAPTGSPESAHKAVGVLFQFLSDSGLADERPRIDATEFRDGTHEPPGYLCAGPTEMGPRYCVAKEANDETVVAWQDGQGGALVGTLLTSRGRLTLFDGATGEWVATIPFPSPASLEHVDIIRYDRAAGRLFLEFGLDYVEIWDQETAMRLVRIPTGYTQLGEAAMSAEINEPRRSLAAYRDQQIFEYRYFGDAREIVEVARAALERQRPE